MNECEPSSNFKCKLKKKHLSTRRRMKVLSALYASIESLKENNNLEDSCDVTKHGQTVLNLLQNERLCIENLKELKKLLMHPILKEPVACTNDMADIVAEILHAHEVIHEDLYNEKCTVATSLTALLPLMKTYKRYSAMIDLNFSKLQEFAYICEEAKMSFYDLLYEPIFQISRYKCLLQDLSDAMPSENTYEHVLLDLNKLSDAIGSEISLKQNMLKSLQVQRLLVKRQPKILNFQRTLLKEGILCEVCHGSKLKSRVVFLFSDVLLCCRLISKSFDWNTKNSLKCCSLLSLRTCSVDFVMGKVLFKVTSGNTSCLFLSETLEDAQSWVKHVQTAIKMCQITQNKPKMNIKRKPVVKQGQSPFLKASEHSASINISVQKSPNVSNVTYSDNTSFKKFKRMLTCSFGMKAF